MNLSKKHIVGQIVRIITPQAGSSGSALTRWQRNNNQQQITFTRIYLCRSHSDLFYIMMTNEMNKHFFHRDLLLRDNGFLSLDLTSSSMHLILLKGTCKEFRW